MNDPQPQPDQGNQTVEGVSASGEVSDLGLVEAVVERSRRALAEARPDASVADPARDDHAEVIVPVVQPGAGTTNTASPVSGDQLAISSRASSQAHVELTKTIAEAAAIPQWRAAQAASFLLDEEGWRPPLPDTLSPWDAYREAYNAFRRDVPSWKAHFTAHHMHALEAALRVYDPCAEHSETQWGVLDQHGQVHTVGVENEAQARSVRSMTPVRREVGPWIEVPRG